MDAIKEEEVVACYEVIENLRLLKWRAGLSEYYNEAKKVNKWVDDLEGVSSWFQTG